MLCVTQRCNFHVILRLNLKIFIVNQGNRNHVKFKCIEPLHEFHVKSCKVNSTFKLSQSSVSISRRIHVKTDASSCGRWYLFITYSNHYNFLDHVY